MADELKIAGWGPPPADLSLGDDEVHVWRGTVKATASELEHLLPELSRRERREMKRHPTPKNYAASRVMIRSLLGRYVGQEPAKVKLKEGPGGRLVLAKAPKGPPHWDFGWGEDRAVFAISASQPLAVHLEVIPRDLDVSRWMRDLPPREASLIEFYSSQNRARFVVGYHAEREAERRLAAYRGESGFPADARVERLRLGKRFVAALAAEGWDWSPSFWRYPRPGREDEPDEDDDD
jgi:4'-phosphopantetheinyl transferase